MQVPVLAVVAFEEDLVGDCLQFLDEFFAGRRRDGGANFQQQECGEEKRSRFRSRKEVLPPRIALRMAALQKLGSERWASAPLAVEIGNIRLDFV